MRATTGICYAAECARVPLAGSTSLGEGKGSWQAWSLYTKPSFASLLDIPIRPQRCRASAGPEITDEHLGLERKSHRRVSLISERAPSNVSEVVTFRLLHGGGVRSAVAVSAFFGALFGSNFCLLITFWPLCSYMPTGMVHGQWYMVHGA
jgi:hypothetical protein